MSDVAIKQEVVSTYETDYSSGIQETYAGEAPEESRGDLSWQRKCQFEDALGRLRCPCKGVVKDIPHHVSSALATLDAKPMVKTDQEAWDNLDEVNKSVPPSEQALLRLLYLCNIVSSKEFKPKPASTAGMIQRFASSIYALLGAVQPVGRSAGIAANYLELKLELREQELYDLRVQQQVADNTSQGYTNFVSALGLYSTCTDVKGSFSLE